MDDDDWCDPDRFEKQLSFLDNHTDIDFVGTNAILFDDNGIWGHGHNIELPQANDFLLRSPFIHPTIMVKKVAYDKVSGYRVGKHMRRTEDYDMFMRMYSAGLKGYNLQDELYHYYMNNDTYKKQIMKYRIDEMIVRYEGFKSLGLLPKGFPYVIKPIISYFIPVSIKTKRIKQK